MEFPRGKPILIDQFEAQNKEQIYVFYRRSKNQDAPNQCSLLYTEEQDYEKAKHFRVFGFNKGETQIVETLLNSENKTDKEALHKFIVAFYNEIGLTRERYNELFSPLKNIYCSQSKLAKVRNKAAKMADRITENLGMENIVKKVTGGKKIEEVKLNTGVKAIEKAISDKLLGKVKE